MTIKGSYFLWIPIILWTLISILSSIPIESLKVVGGVLLFLYSIFSIIYFCYSFSHDYKYNYDDTFNNRSNAMIFYFKGGNNHFQLSNIIITRFNILILINLLIIVINRFLNKHLTIKV